MPKKQNREEPATGRPLSNLDRAKLRLKERQAKTKQTLRELKGDRPKKPDIL